MKVFLLVMCAMFAASCASVLCTKPGQPREPMSAGVILIAAVIYLSLAIWAGSLLMEMP